MRWVKRIAWTATSLLALAVVAIGIGVIATARNPARPIGAQQLVATDPGHPAIPVLLLYPTSDAPRWRWLGLFAVKLAPGGAVDGQELALVTVSHGTGGTSLSHLDTALALAEAGYVVALPVHPGDNLHDQASVGTSTWMPDRARHIARVDDFVLEHWPGRAHLDRSRLGLFGFSAGGTTALITAGGTPDMELLGTHCADAREFVCELIAKGGTRAPGPSEWVHDDRVRAAVLVAPGLGFTFTPAGLAAVDVPVQIWAGTEDRTVPLDTNAAVISRGLSGRATLERVEHAAHYSFLPPCGALSALLPRALCTDPPGFDRRTFQADFNAAVVRFFDETLERRGHAEVTINRG